MERDGWIATAVNGRLTLDVETEFADGTKIDLVRRVESPRCDLLLFVTTESERAALRSVASRMGLPLDPIAGRFSEYLDLGRLHRDYRVFAVETEMGALRAGGSATKGVLCPVETGARFVVAAGMAFGIYRTTQKYGDVLVASHVFPYDSVLIDTESDGRLPRVRYDRVAVTETNSALRELLGRQVIAHAPGFAVHSGVLLSGSAQIRCRAYRDHLVWKSNKRLETLDKERQKQKRRRVLSERVVGGEMEGVGLLAAPVLEGNASWLIVKGISDFADEEHRDDSLTHRTQACEHAIELVLSALKNAPNPETEPTAA